MKLSSKKKFYIAILTISFLIVAVIFLYFIRSKSDLVINPLGRYFLVNWRSFRKMPNLLHLPYWFAKTDLETYRIVINPNIISEMNESLPVNDDFAFGDLLESDKYFVNAYFVSPADNYEAKIKIRYRGLIYNNWDSEQKAYRIKFPKDGFFQGMRSLNLFIPKDRAYLAEALNSHRAKKFGLVAPEFKFIRVQINNRPSSVYLSAEAWSKEFLARENLVDTDNIFSNKDIKFSAEDSLFSADELSNWKSYTAENEEGYFEELETLLKLITYADDKEFSKKIGNLVDLRKFYYWQIVNVLAGSNHQGDTGNFVLLFKKETGKFEPLSWDVNMYAPDEKLYSLAPTLTKRILNNDQFFNEYNKLLREYVSNGENLKDDLAYYDNLYAELKKEFYKDQAKLDNDFIFNKEIKRYRELIIANFENAKKIALTEKFPQDDKIPASPKSFNFTGSFAYFNDISKNIDDFVNENIQFQKVNDGAVVLKEGTHIFAKTVIVPSNLRLVIEPGAKLFFFPRVSLISYSPVNAIGTDSSPIVLGPVFSGGEPWGVFGIINTGDTNSIFKQIKVSGGSEAAINGVHFLSQFSLHNANSQIEDSVFTNGKSDDGLHAILGSVNIKRSIFTNNSSDAVDFDYISNGTIEDSFFSNTEKEGSNGDGIDISGSLNLQVKNNKIMNYGDKCISIGESALQVIVEKNILANCNIGIAVKDSSNALINENIIVGNRDSGISLYRKKQEFIKGGRADIKDSVIWGNGQEIEKDDLSFLTISRSVVKDGYSEGQEISSEKPDFRQILPAFLFQLVGQKL